MIHLASSQIPGAMENGWSSKPCLITKGKYTSNMFKRWACQRTKRYPRCYLINIQLIREKWTGNIRKPCKMGSVHEHNEGITRDQSQKQWAPCTPVSNVLHRSHAQIRRLLNAYMCHGGDVHFFSLVDLLAIQWRSNIIAVFNQMGPKHSWGDVWDVMQEKPNHNSHSRRDSQSTITATMCLRVSHVLVCQGPRLWPGQRISSHLAPRLARLGSKMQQ